MIAQLLYVLNDSNQTNEALVSAFGKIEPEYKVSQVVPFSSRRKLSAASFEGLGTLIMGAPEFVLTPTEQKRIETRSREYLEQGLRVLVFAHSKNEIKGKNLPTGVKAVSLILIEDNIRRDAIYTINFFKENNVDLKVISGDNAVTVSHIAERAGIRDADKYISLEGLTDKQVREAAPKYNVFGRVSPEQKQLLIESLKESGRTVGMVGDGVNDILALKEADASIAMASGSEATRNVSHLVLLDSSFSSMPKVVSEGRRVINNVQNVATIFLTKTIFSMLLTLIVLALNVTYPLTPSQLFIIDFLAIGIPSFFISLQPNNKLVKGTFLKNVLKSATPGAFAMVAQVVLIITYLDYKLNLSILEQNALVVITASFTAMVVLYRTLKPLNTYRRTLFIVMFTIATLAVFLLPEFFNFSALTPFYIRMGMAEVELISFSCATLLLVMLLSSPILINLFEKVPHWIKVGTSWILRKLTGI
jgi:cation-transporting ATPase E